MPNFDDQARRHLLASDQALLRNYANQRTVAALKDIRLSTFRHVVWRLSVLVPRATHGSPGWSNAHPPALVVGRMDRRGAISIEKQGFGLRAVGRHLHIFLNRQLLDDMAAQLGNAAEVAGLDVNGLWPLWMDRVWMPPAYPIPTFRYFSVPVDLPEAGNPPPGHPLADNQPLARLLRTVNELPRLEHPDQNRIDEELAPLREAANEPGGLSAIYPRLVEQYMNRPRAR